MVAWALDSEILLKILVLVLSGFSLFLIISGAKDIRSRQKQSVSDLGLSQEQRFESAKRREDFWHDFWKAGVGTFVIIIFSILVFIVYRNRMEVI